MWTVFTSMQRKLYDKIEEMKKTASLIDVTGVRVDRREGKAKECSPQIPTVDSKVRSLSGRETYCRYPSLHKLRRALSCYL